MASYPFLPFFYLLSILLLSLYFIPLFIPSSSLTFDNCNLKLLFFFFYRDEMVYSIYAT